MTNYYTPSGPKVAIYGIVVFAAFLAMVYFVRHMYQSHDPGRINQARAEARVKARTELAATSREALSTAGWVDEARGVVRLPISVAMELMVRNYRDGQGAQASLAERVEKATAPLPAAPEQPSEFE